MSIKQRVKCFSCNKTIWTKKMDSTVQCNGCSDKVTCLMCNSDEITYLVTKFINYDSLLLQSMIEILECYSCQFTCSTTVAPMEIIQID